jgi:hypothetical protein
MKEIERHRKIGGDVAVAAYRDGFRDGIAEGVAKERARVKALLDFDIAPAAATRPRKRAIGNSAYGRVMNAVRPALRDFGGAMDVGGMAKLVGSGISRDQCRSAMQQLVRNGEAVKADRGKFLWRPASEPPPIKNPDDGAARLFAQAAE